MTLGVRIGVAVASVVAAALVVPLGAVAWRADGWDGLRPSDWGALRFTLGQAMVSAALSVLLAVPVARALARRRFAGRGAVILLLGAPFILPVIVAVLGLVAVFGRSGPVNTLLTAVGLEPVSIYGAHGVVLAHVFFNMPLATRLIVQGWQAIPGERLRLAASLGFTTRDTFRLLEWPMLRAVVPGVFLVIFLICTTSFAVALALGGGPNATTVELAIYEAFRFDFDLGRAAMLGALQLILGATAAVLSLRLALPSGFGAGQDRVVPRWDSQGWAVRMQDSVAIGLACAFLLLPVAIVLGDGIGHVTTLPAAVWWGALRSLVIAVAAALLTTSLALAMAIAATRPHGGWIEVAGTLSVAASPLVLGTGLFLLVLPVANPVVLALPVTLFVNVVLGLPFALRALIPAMRDLIRDYDRLSASLNLSGWAWLRLVGLPRLRRPLGFAAGLTAALAAGDLGVIALFASPDQATLPLVLYQLMGSYRMDEAKAAALLLIALSLGVFWLFERGSRDA
ncbi:thiamine/thiamine pyrophosphate ABC transporter permease ThiP [Jannaschia pagri]|uniref:Thiamine/thiamine pyrophosphate ABC transporter permease ThiP n=1 Tax=Jannaschia pagri TaxID=2829797 RepID=A0ABQ4NLD2_9RHOB|nr:MULTISPECIES: thiamine/thiamine pyrophosphate ABC transporter permease ThiP [unclassified Jannaschia]GIT91360.1 thiamine/thiamine pyrophosphate ABC transporter permease ThiP [Jannaschia sp. AI_61]GIT95194.1 thiamine/thiamine pyrophosphate ABC transporter permease ThiP [Jannaschia sp. AI_62]